MNCYLVTLRKEVWIDVYVHAGSPQEAMSLAYEKAVDLCIEEVESELEPLVSISKETCDESHLHQYEDETDEINDH
jgi:hypothetical protein